MSEIQEAVANGAQMLDQTLPGWYHLINLDTLQLEDCNKCVCGQLAQSLGWQLFPDMEMFPSKFGFDLPYAAAMKLDYDEQELVWKKLDEEWFDAITARRAFDKLPNAEREAVIV